MKVQDEDKVTIRKVEKVVRDWYDFGRASIPQIDSDTFGYFAGTATSLARSVTKDYTTYRYIVDMKAPTAYIDNSKMVIALPGWYFSKVAIGKLFEGNEEALDFEAVSLALCNGSSIHETLHLAHTPKITLKEMVEKAVEYMTADVFGKYEKVLSSSVAETIMNISEDLRIEGFPVTMNPDMVSTSIFIALKNSILFQAKTFEAVCKALEEAKTDNEIFLARINVATSFKNRKLLSASLHSKNATIAKIAKTASTISSSREGFQRNFILLLVALAEDLDIDLSKESKDGEGEKASGSDGGEDAAGEETSSKEPTSTSTGGSSVASDDEKAALKAMIEAGDDELESIERIAKAFEGAAASEGETYRREAVIEGDEPFSSFKPIYEDDIMKLLKKTGWASEGTPRLDSSTDWSFVSLLKQLRSKNHTPGELKRSGTIMTKTHLNRIATDGKIFGTKTFEKRTSHEIEVVILVDYSGSMDTIIRRVVGTTLGFFNALKKVGINVDAYGHTSAPGNSSVPMLFKVCSGGISGRNHDVHNRFAQSLNIMKSQNYDSVILQKLASLCFKSKKVDTKKIIFVLSDGAPAGNDYGGRAAINHTKDVVANIRKSGVNVIAISLVEGVVKENNVIYGEQFNVNASRDLKESFSKLVVRLQKENSL